MKSITWPQTKQWMSALFILCVMGMIGNFVGYGVSFLTSLPGMAVLFIIGLLSLFLKQLIPTSLPALVYTSILGMVLALPFSPVASIINPLVNEINLMAIVTPILAYAGLTIGKDWNEFRRLGWRAVVVGLVVIFSSFLWACIIAQVLMKAMNVI